ncbi:hypothetical protein AAVH_25179 [Aphelenchoides avenae]|nr:hypothetical protein AAVH_25179 [Aphelenchus avenae]
MQFLSQFAVVLRSTLVVLNVAFIDSNPLGTFLQTINTWLIVLACLSPPICLFTTSKTLRRCYMNFCAQGCSPKTGPSGSAIRTGSSKQRIATF